MTGNNFFSKILKAVSLILLVIAIAWVAIILIRNGRQAPQSLVNISSPDRFVLTSQHLQEMPGAILFKTKTCYTCHTIGKGRLVGPDLKGLFERRDEAWLRKYIPNPIEMTQTDPIAIQLHQEYKAQMPNLRITPSELDQLLAYLRRATK